MPEERNSKVTIELPTEVAETVFLRLAGLHAVLLASAACLENGDDEAERAVPDALRYAAAEIERLKVDVDICSWPTGSDAKEAA